MTNPHVQAVLLCLILTLLLAFIEVKYQSKAKPTVCISLDYFLFVFALALGNTAATLIASNTIISKIPDSIVEWSPFFFAFFGVFAFEGILSNTNITIFDKGVLTIQNWISLARNNAVATAVEKQVRQVHDLELTAANVLKKLDEKELNTFLATSFGPESVNKIETDALTSGADSKLYKALELVSKDPERASTILRSQQKKK